jgi:hypothetical protein
MGSLFSLLQPFYAAAMEDYQKEAFSQPFNTARYQQTKLTKEPDP